MYIGGVWHWISLPSIADWASILGVAVSIGGFWATLCGVRKSTSAAEAARKSAHEVKGEIFKSNALIQLAGAAQGMEEIKQLQRAADWRTLLPRYSSLRSSLIGISSTHQSLTPEHQTTIQGAIIQLRTIEKKVEQALTKGRTEDLDAAKLNAIMSEEIDKISTVLGRLRSDTYAGQDMGSGK